MVDPVKSSHILQIKTFNINICATNTSDPSRGENKGHNSFGIFILSKDLTFWYTLIAFL